MVNKSAPIEQQAQLILDQSQNASGVELRLLREIALVLRQLSQIRSTHSKLRSECLNNECEIDSEILNLWKPSPDRHDRLVSQRQSLQRERRQLALQEEVQIQQLQNRLFEILEGIRVTHNGYLNTRQ